MIDYLIVLFEIVFLAGLVLLFGGIFVIGLMYLIALSDGDDWEI